ncbi:MAG: hypothetical protein DRI01_10740 [Chloroflexi bacterium]|nr:MAG: hypothetical protein DRI01_10740 [Chloroflexota bacterium]
MEFEYCTRCHIRPPGEFLRDIAYSKKRSLQDILRQAQQDEDSSLYEEASKQATQRQQEDMEKLRQYEAELEQLEEDSSYDALDKIMQDEDIDEIAEQMLDDEVRKDLQEKIIALKWKPEGLSEEDVKQALKEYEKQGYIEIHEGNVKITSIGARRLATNALEKILGSLGRTAIGVHSIEETGFGSELATYTRHYEAGDDYSLVDIERTALNALERTGQLELEPNDFEVNEEIHQSRLCAGLLIDESGSMRTGNKLEGAMESALALAELIRREPKDSLRTFLFSDTVKEVPSWAIVNETLGGDSTDIKGVLRAFRETVRSDKGDKQAYLITDTDPNTEDGRYVGFDRAVAGVIEEALRCRQDGIGLNIVMLDNTPHLRELASTLARKNLGRVFFTSPLKLGEVIVEDYLKSKGGRL